MKRQRYYDKSFIIILALFLFSSVAAFAGQNFYISETTGNDSNNGLTPQTAWKTLAKMNESWSLVNPGDSVLLKRGDTFSYTTIRKTGEGMLNVDLHKSGTASNYITIGAYGSGAKPIITGGSGLGYHHGLLQKITIPEMEQ